MSEQQPEHTRPDADPTDDELGPGGVAEGALSREDDVADDELGPGGVAEGAMSREVDVEDAD